MTAVEKLVQEINKLTGLTISMDELCVVQAKEIENIEKLKRQLFMGKVSEIIGIDKTIELWKECIETFKSK